MDINIKEADKFLRYHSNPNELISNDLTLLKEWIQEYPYCQSLRFLETQACKTTPYFEESLATAAAFASSRETLYQFIHQTQSFESEIIVLDESEELQSIIEIPASIDEEILPETLEGEEITEEEKIETPKEEIVFQTKESSDAGFGNAFGVDLNHLIVSEDNDEEEIIENSAIEIENLENPIEEEIQEEDIQAIADDNEVQEETVEVEAIETLENPFVEDVQEVESIQAVADENEVQKETVEDLETLENPIVEDVQEVESIQAVADENEVQEETVEVEAIENLETQIEEDVQEIESFQAVAEDNEIQKERVEVKAIEALENSIEEDVQETESTQAVAEDNQHQEHIVEVEENSIEEEVIVDEVENHETEIDTSDSLNKENPVLERKSKEELFFDNPVSSDFFAFSKAEKPIPEEKVAEKVSLKDEDENLAQYFDETLPYSFLWWLNKTRKEHAANTQPYTKPKVNPQKVEKNVDTVHLNHQIAENIFHLRGVEEISQKTSSNFTIPFDFRRKEYQIIEKFIKEEPQIKHPAPNKIDTENKAKKSSEDANEVVSETLAKIYVEQMLYHKALDVYKKLNLKYPEKSAYFASQIKYLELKVN